MVVVAADNQMCVKVWLVRRLMHKIPSVFSISMPPRLSVLCTEFFLNASHCVSWICETLMTWSVDLCLGTPMGKWKPRWEWKMQAEDVLAFESPKESVFSTYRGKTHLYAHRLLPCLSRTCRHTQQAICAWKNTIKYYSFKLSLFRFASFVHPHFQRFLTLCCQSFLQYVKFLWDFDTRL